MRFNPPSPEYLGPPTKFSEGQNKPIRRIVIHCTVSPCVEGGAERIAAYFRSQGAGGSAHYVVDPGKVVQSAYDSVIAWHAPPNKGSLGVELCDPMPTHGGREVQLDRWADEAHQRMLRRAERLVARLCLAYDVPIKRLFAEDLLSGALGIPGHVDVSRAFEQSSHWDPGAGFPWPEFMRGVRVQAEKIRARKAART